MPFCGRCGAEHRISARFCGRCGYALSRSASSDSTTPAGSISPRLRTKLPSFVADALRPNEDVLAAYPALARANRRRAESVRRKVVLTTQRLMIVRDSLLGKGIDEVSYKSVSGVSQRKGFLSGHQVVIHIPRATLTLPVGTDEAPFIDQLISVARSGRPWSVLTPSLPVPAISPPGPVLHQGGTLDTIDPLDFERLVRELFERMGYHASLTHASHDGGVDIEVFDPTPIRGGRFIVQCKRYSGVVGAQYVRDLYGVVQHTRATKGILVSTSHFSPDGMAFARGKPLELIDRTQLDHLLRSHGLMDADTSTFGTTVHRQ